MARWRTLHRVDSTAQALIAEVKRLGACYAPADGTYDGVLWIPQQGRIEVIDWKSPGAGLTPGQAKLVAAGWPVRFVSTTDQLAQLVRQRS